MSRVLNILRSLAYVAVVATLSLCLPSPVYAQETVELNLNALPDSLGTPIRAVVDTVAPAPSGPRVSAYDVDDDKPITVMHYYDKHGNQLKQPVMFLATLDTVSKPKSRPVYPAFNGVDISANFGDLLFLAFGSHYASFDVRAAVSVWNWIFPVVEGGVGFADASPKSLKYSVRVKPSPFFRVGFDYNFVYKSSPDYRGFIGFRAGYSHFNYDLLDIPDPRIYSSGHFDKSGLLCDAWWGEAVAGLKVKIAGCFSLGWDARYKFPFRIPKCEGYKPWFIPGYGSVDSPFGISISAIFTIGTPKPKEENKL